MQSLGTPLIELVLCTFRIARSEEHTSELQSQSNLVCRLLLEKKKTNIRHEYVRNIGPALPRPLGDQHPVLPHYKRRVQQTHHSPNVREHQRDYASAAHGSHTH